MQSISSFFSSFFRESQSPFSQLPDELVINIMEKMPLVDLTNFQLSSARFRKIYLDSKCQFLSKSRIQIHYYKNILECMVEKLGKTDLRGANEGAYEKAQGIMTKIGYIDLNLYIEGHKHRIYDNCNRIIRECLCTCEIKKQDHVHTYECYCPLREDFSLKDNYETPLKLRIQGDYSFFRDNFIGKTYKVIKVEMANEYKNSQFISNISSALASLNIMLSKHNNPKLYFQPRAYHSSNSSSGSHYYDAGGGASG